MAAPSTLPSLSCWGEITFTIKPHTRQRYSEGSNIPCVHQDHKMVGWHHQLNGHGFGWTLGVGDGQGGLACCGSWCCKELDMAEFHTPAAFSCPGENARSWEALGEARPGQSSLSAGALRYRAWAQPGYKESVSNHQVYPLGWDVSFGMRIKEECGRWTGR